MIKKNKFAFWHKKRKEMWSVESINWQTKEVSNGGDVASLDDGDLLQSTGLFDKNEKEIYEGDLLKSFGETKILICDGKERYSPHWEISKVVFVEGCFQAVILAQENSYFGKIPSNPRIFFKPDVYLEAIGNIFQNPELLGGEDE